MKRLLTMGILLAGLSVQGAMTMTVTGRVASDSTNTGILELGDEVSFTYSFNDHPRAGLDFADFQATANYWIHDSAWDNPDTAEIEGVSIWTNVESEVLSGTLSNDDTSYEPREDFHIRQHTDLSGTLRTQVRFHLISEMSDTGLLFGGKTVAGIGGTVYTQALSFTYPEEETALSEWIRFHQGDYTIDPDPGLYDEITLTTQDGGILILDPVGSFSGTSTGSEPITWMGFTADENGYMDTGEFMGVLYVGEFPNIYSYQLQNWFDAGPVGGGSGGESGAYLFVYRPGN